MPLPEPASAKPAPRVLGEVLLLFLLVTLVIAALVRVPSELVQRYLSAVAAGLFLFTPTLLLQRRGLYPADYGLHLDDLARSLRAFALAALLVVPLFSLGYWLYLDHLCPRLPFWLTHYTRPQARALRLPPDLHWLALHQLVVVALPEEFFFRGYMQGRLSEVLPPRRALLLSSALFALGHLVVTPQVGSLAVFFPGLLFGLLRQRTGGVLAGGLLHALCNLLIDVLHRSLG